MPAQVSANSYELPSLLATLDDGNTVTINDHEPLLAEFDITRA